MSATAETSATVFIVQPVSVCQLGFAKTVLQPLPASSHAVSVQPRGVVVSWVKLVPPTDMTNGDAAGKLTPGPSDDSSYAWSPDEAVMSTPG
jgi:hypothetical protein